MEFLIIMSMYIDQFWLFTYIFIYLWFLIDKPFFDSVTKQNDKLVIIMLKNVKISFYNIYLFPSQQSSFNI